VVLIDAGPAYPGGADTGGLVILPALRALGVERLDVLILTHADLDHRGGALSVLRGVPVGEVWLPRGGIGDEGFAGVVEFCAARGIPIELQARGEARRSIGDLTIDVLWPPAEGERIGGRNAGSLVVGIDILGTRLLATGDIDRRTESRLLVAPERLRSDILKVGHHGSATSSTPAFLAAAQPTLAVVSAPCGGGRGLPAQAALRRIARAGAGLRWTGRDGAVIVTLGRTGTGPMVSTYRGEPRQCPEDPERATGHSRSGRAETRERLGSIRLGDSNVRETPF